MNALHQMLGTIGRIMAKQDQPVTILGLKMTESNGVQACGVILTLIFTIAVEYVFSDSSSSGEDDDDGGASTRYM